MELHNAYALSTDKPRTPRGKPSILAQVNKHKWALLLLVPGIVVFVLFSYLPMYGVIIAFKDFKAFKGVWGSEWVGLEHFIDFFINPYCFRIIKNTLLLSLYDMLWGFPAPLVLALLFNEVRNQKFKRITQTISYFPHFLSLIVVIGILKQMTASDGVFNQILTLFGQKEPIIFFTEARYFRSMYIASGVWQEIGFSSILYLAAIAGIDPTLLDVAEVDGAGRFRRMFHITLPSILPTIIILLIFRIGDMLNVSFEKVLLMYNPGIYDVADVINTYVYREGIERTMYDYTTAVGLFNSVVSFILIFLANRFSRRVSEISLW